MNAKHLFWMGPLVVAINIAVILGVVYGAAVIIKHVWGN